MHGVQNGIQSNNHITVTNQTFRSWSGQPATKSNFVRPALPHQNLPRRRKPRIFMYSICTFTARVQEFSSRTIAGNFRFCDSLHLFLITPCMKQTHRTDTRSYLRCCGRTTHSGVGLTILRRRVREVPYRLVYKTHSCTRCTPRFGRIFWYQG